MTTYYVDGNSGNDSNNGSSDSPWKKLSKAASSVKPGDEVRIRTATYKETLTIRTKNTTWRADTGHTPVLDGGYHDGLFRPDGTLPTPKPEDGYLPGDTNASMITLGDESVVVDGLTIKNCAGAGISASSSNCVIRNCRLDFLYRSGIKVNAGTFVDNVIAENNVLSRIVQRVFDPNREGPGPQAAGAGITMVRTRDGIIRNNIVAYSMGEGIDVDKGSYRLVVEGNVVHTCNHVHIYVNRSIDPIIRNNLVFHQYTPAYLGVNERAPSGITFGDEHAQGNPWPPSSGGEIYNNVVIGMGRLFMVRNNENNYDTQLKNAYIGYNTFIGGKLTEVGVQISGNVKGRPHQDSIFENNIVINAPVISQASGDLGGIAFRNNLWSEQPHAAMRGPGDRIGNPNLVDPSAAIKDIYPDPANTGVDPRNYQLTSRSTMAIGMASDGSHLNGLRPPTIHKDFFGANRDDKPDIGAHEYAGVVTALAANFSIGPGQDTGAMPHTVDFIDKSTSDAPIVSRVWDFGDQTTSNETNPSHTYTLPGTFDVSLTVTDNNGNSDKLTQRELITVSPEPNAIIPDTFRRFALVKQEDMAVLAYGTQYPDLRCIVVWSSEPFHLMNFNDINDVVRSITEPGRAEVFWVDPGDQDEPVLTHDDELYGIRPESTRVGARA